MADDHMTTMELPASLRDDLRAEAMLVARDLGLGNVPMWFVVRKMLEQTRKDDPQ